MQEKFTFNIESPRVKKKMILFKEEMETREHVVLKALAYILFYDERLKIEVGIGTHYKPDLVIEGDHGVPELWIDCGRITLKKAEGITSKFKKTRIVIVKMHKNETTMFKKQAEKKLEHMENLQFVYFDNGFVEKIAAALGRSNDFCQWQVTEDDIAVALNEEVFESRVHIL